MGIAGAAALGFAVFLSDLGPFPIVEVGDGLIQKARRKGRRGRV